MTPDDTAQPGGAPAMPPASQARLQAAEVPTVPWRWDNRHRRGRRVLLPAAAAGAAVTAFLLTDAIGAQHGSHPPAAAPTKPTTVEVNGAVLRGQPVKAVRRQLRHLGLQVRLRWRPSSRLSPGKVVSVRPAGRNHDRSG